MGAVFYNDLDDVKATEQDWIDDEEFEEMNVDPQLFNVSVNIENRSELQNITKVFISFFEHNQTNSNIQTIGQIESKFLQGTVLKITDTVVWFRLSSLERLPSRSFTSKVIEKLCAELFPKYLSGQSIYLLSQQPSYDHQFDYYTNEKNSDFKSYQHSQSIMLPKASEGLFFEFCIQNQKKIHVLKLPKILDEVEGLKEFLPAPLFTEIQMTTKNNYLLSSNNLYA